MPEVFSHASQYTAQLNLPGSHFNANLGMPGDNPLHPNLDNCVQIAQKHLFGSATYRDLAHCCQARLQDKGTSEVSEAVSQETQAERNKPNYESSYFDGAACRGKPDPKNEGRNRR
jgi:hypothetical protein